MNTLINTLPTRSSSNNSIIRVLFNTGESNVFTNDHVAAARAKYWTPYRWNGSTWVEILASTPGDVSGDGVVNWSDVDLISEMASVPTGIKGVERMRDGDNETIPETGWTNRRIWSK